MNFQSILLKIVENRSYGSFSYFACFFIFLYLKFFLMPGLAMWIVSKYVNKWLGK